MVSNSDWSLIVIYINVALYATCYQMQRPLEPFLVEKLDTSSDYTAEYARLQTFFFVVQTIGALFFGRMLDKVGARIGFAVNFAASAASYFLLSQATTMNMLYLSKVPSMFQAGFLCAQVAIVQCTPEGPGRLIALGRLTMSYTIGAIIGPTLGGWLGASGDYYFGGTLATIGSLISCVWFLFFFTLPAPIEDTKAASETTKEKEEGSVSKATSTNSMGLLVQVLQAVWVFLSLKTITGCANAMNQTVFPLIMKNNYQFQEQQMGVTMSVLSVFSAFTNGVLLQPITQYAQHNVSTVITWSLRAMFVLQFVLVAVTHESLLTMLDSAYGVNDENTSALMKGALYLVFTILLGMCQYVLSTSITAESTSRVNAGEKGLLLGLEHSSFAVARIGCPYVSIQLLQHPPVGAVYGGGVCVVSTACAVIFTIATVLWETQSSPGKLRSSGGEGGDSKEKEI